MDLDLSTRQAVELLGIPRPAFIKLLAYREAFREERRRSVDELQHIGK